MIKVRIRNDDREVDVQLPVREGELYARLAEIHAAEDSGAAPSALVTEVYWPEELSVLKNHAVNLDELNYLARRMESFDALEYDQFLVGITKLENPSMKDLINLTFNLDTVKIRKSDSKKAPPSISEEMDGGALPISVVSCCAYFAGRTMTCPS